WQYVQAFLETNPDPQNKEIKQKQEEAYGKALLDAVLADKHDVIKMLLAKGGENIGWFALRFAIQNRNHELLRKLLDIGASANAGSEDHHTTLHNAFQQYGTEAIAILFEKGAKPDYEAFTKAARQEKRRHIQAFVEANPEPKDEDSKQKQKDAYG